MRPTLLVGLDGGTFDVVDPLIARGELPHLARLIARGVRAPLRSTLPPLTAPAWPSMICGVNPGRHGIYRFEVLDHITAATREARPVSSAAFAGRTLFDYLGGLGGRVLGVYVPMTFPAWPVAGRLLAGYPNPDPSQFFAYPADWSEELRRRVPPPPRVGMADATSPIGARRRVDEARAHLEALGDHVAELIVAERPDFTMVVVSATDAFQHWFWHLRGTATAADDPIDEVYRLSDALIGKLVRAVGDDAVVAVASDHGGGCAPERHFVVNSWLRNRGLYSPPEGGAAIRRPAFRFLRRLVHPALKSALRRALPGPARSGLQRMETASKLPDWSRTQAYFVRLAYPIGGINVNVAGREPAGIVSPGVDFEQIRDRIVADLPTARDPDGEPRAIANVWKREEVFSGPFAENAPDVLFEVEERYFPAGGVAPVEFRTVARAGSGAKSGEHRLDGMLVIASPGAMRGGARLPVARIEDVAPTLLRAMGVEVPGDLDGRVLDLALGDDDVVESAATPRSMGQALNAGKEYSEEEERGIRAALRDLGYIE